MSSSYSYRKESVDGYTSLENKNNFEIEGKELVFKFGMDRDSVLFEGNDMETLKELAAAFIESKV